jgi:mercuric ion transport protein
MPNDKSRWRLALAVTAWLFAACVLAQIALAGLGIFAGPSWWPRHRAFVHTFEWLTVVIFALTFAARATSAIKWLAAALLALLSLQYTFIEQRLVPARSGWAALHVVGAVLIFWIATEIGRRAQALRRG